MNVSFPGGVRVEAEYKGFVIKTDQPAYQDGEGSEPSPFDLFLASIATCAGYYVLAFCNKRGISAEKASLIMRTSRSPETKMIEKISIEIQLPSEFPEKYKNAVIKAVDGCSVKIHILNPPAFEIEAKISK
ncbi:MAG: osmotically inducible protein OsmC [Candidatus Aminicenantes bacterium]|nr:osmotically inducible protein OsmC [Candidatus Aminicenantes bacterium]